MLEKRLDNIETTLGSIRDELKILAINSATQNEQLKEHMRRTAAVEKYNEMFSVFIEQQSLKLERKLKPIEKFVDRAKFLGGVTGVGGSILAGLIKLGFLHFTL
jgi:hypothetical protein